MSNFAIEFSFQMLEKVLYFRLRKGKGGGSNG